MNMLIIRKNRNHTWFFIQSLPYQRENECSSSRPMTRRNPPYIWATANPADLRSKDKLFRDMKLKCEDYLEVIAEEIPEVSPECKDEVQRVLTGFNNTQPDLVAQSLADASRDLVNSLPADKTNWYQIYADIKRHLKGLQNRKRIWEQMESFMAFGLGQEAQARQFGSLIGYSR